MKKKFILRYLFWTLALATAVFIFFFSAQSRTQSSTVSTGLLTGILKWFYPRFDQLTIDDQLQLLNLFHAPLRKLAHFTMFAALGFFTSGAMYTYALPKRKAAGVALVICILRAAADEIHQSFVPGRGPQLQDVGIDTLGALAGILVLTLCYILYVRHRKKRSI